MAQIYQRHKVPHAICTGENFEAFHKWKWLNKLSQGSWRIHRVSMKLQQWGIVVTNGPTPSMTSFVTSHHVTPPISIFGAQNGPPSIHARRDTEDPRQLPRGRLCDKNTSRHCQVGLKTQIWLPETFGECTRPDGWLPSFQSMKSPRLFCPRRKRAID